MTFVSYAQNHEDVMLARVFRGVESGFYIDVGAQDPRIDSVTKAFYERGWRGINLEPVEAWCEKLRHDRPRDINLCLAAGAAEGEVDFHEVVDTGLSTSSEAFAQRHQAQGHCVVTRKVRVRTLDAICAEFGVHDVHFLKVDAEGDEGAVLQGIDLARWRPWIILVEATEPNARVSTHHQWEPLLVDRGYDFVHDDGLNRFYLAREHAALAAAFALPPNVFDDFVLRQVVDHRNHAAGLATHLAAVEALSTARAEAITRLEQMVAQKDEALVESMTRHASDLESNARVQAQFQAQLVRCDAELSALREVISAHESDLQSRQARIDALTTRLQGADDTVAQLSRSLLDAHAARVAAEAGWAAAVVDHQQTLAELGRAQADYQTILASRSWRLTRPLRWVMTRILAVRERSRGMPSARSDRPPSPPMSTAVETASDPSVATAPPVVAVRALPLTEDAEQILARCPVLDPAHREGVR